MIADTHVSGDVLDPWYPLVPCTLLGDLQGQQYCRLLLEVNSDVRHCDWAYSTFLVSSDFRFVFPSPEMHSTLFAEPVKLHLSS